MTDIRSALEAAREALRLLLATPEIADAHPADKDEETHVAERKARASLAQIGAALASLDAPQGEAKKPTYDELQNDVRTLCRILLTECGIEETARVTTVAIQARSAPAPAPDALREALKRCTSALVNMLDDGDETDRYGAHIALSDGLAALARLKEGDSGATDQPKGKR